MHEDLRRRALESGKTVSSKARSKQSSRGSSKANSATNSRAVSRIQSRDVSDDEDYGNGNLSDDTTQSINSIDALLDSDDFNEQTTDVMRTQLTSAIDNLLERKGSSVAGRETNLTTYVRCLTSHYLAEVLYRRVPDLLDSFERSIKAEASEKEVTLALRAVALTAITFEDGGVYESMAPVLKRSISDSQSLAIKTAAIYSLGLCLSFGGAGEEEMEQVMTFLLEVASSDGSFIDAHDSSDVVAAAINTYAFLATYVEDLEHESEDAVAAFLDQLDSSDARVQIAAGEAIALLYEKSYTPREDDDSSSDEGEESSGSDAEPDRSGLVKRYNAYHNSHEVLERVKALSSLSTKSMNRRDKRDLHQAFACVATTVENPKLGLQSNNASKMTVRVHREGEMKVDKWWKLMRLNAIRRLLASGFVNHYYEGNKQVLDALPMIMRSTGDEGMRSPRKGLGTKVTKGRYRDNRRFISGDLLEP
ncbi:uncharacterized protein PV06_04765 [Exophiala oligosperma]|uniref:Interferon-related developmental regulator N-terminal domain-containing protein n=2 Tax=Chaetothyriales TaxID=34395 RepID=A0A0D2E786_9EURO|nr:uncharacterized protein PV06_04765 [Exophiala oligosperma]KAJ9623019.1 hypothetical protein H2204_011277 [Knufia peltigerae]KIW43689.1 hypothetical protein PV06_04765 [Exophiala oligosperma]